MFFHFFSPEAIISATLSNYPGASVKYSLISSLSLRSFASKSPQSIFVLLSLPGDYFPFVSHFRILTVVRSRFFFFDYHFNPFVLSILPVVHEDLLKFAICHFSILFSRRISSMQKSIACHQFNLMKDKHTINLILISSK